MGALAIATMGEADIKRLKDHCVTLAKSGLVPDHYAKNPAAIYTAIDMSRALGEEPVTFMQHTFFIGGRAGLTAAYMLSRMRRLKVIRGTVRYIAEGRGTPNLQIRATCVDAETGETIEGPTVSMALAKAEGWTKNAKYTSMPEVMLRKRAITFLTRDHYPDVLMGMLTVDELEDMQHARGTVTAAVRSIHAPATGGILASVNEEVEREVIDAAPAMREPGEDEADEVNQ